ncbi:MAG: hypothetical protein Q8R76_12840 [Candidatus Omnitrophota bacterium]|nr:hypothetical protein [Candidatus Omnitrophota bacterium]
MEPAPQKPKWYYGIVTVLAALFLVLGPLAFPLLWKSPCFNRFWKIFLTVFVSGLTIALMAGSWHTFNTLMEKLREYGVI